MVRTFKDIKLRVYHSMIEYEKEENIEHSWADAEGNILNMKTEDIDFSGAQEKEHFAGDDTYVTSFMHWLADPSPDGRGIVCIVINKVPPLSFRDIIGTCGHELGHLTDGTAFANATQPYESEAGHEQEEKRGKAFEVFAEDTFDIAMLFVEMFKESGYTVTNNAHA
jgi:hypothetical protein